MYLIRNQSIYKMLTSSNAVLNNLNVLSAVRCPLFVVRGESHQIKKPNLNIKISRHYHIISSPSTFPLREKNSDRMNLLLFYIVSLGRKKNVIMMCSIVDSPSLVNFSVWFIDFYLKKSKNGQKKRKIWWYSMNG